MDRVILHCDLNNFYASVETFYTRIQGKTHCGLRRSEKAAWYRAGEKSACKNYGCENRRHRMAGSNKNVPILQSFPRHSANT